MTDLNVVKDLNTVAHNFLKDFNPANYEDGRHELVDGLYVSIETYETKYRKDTKFESHEKYIDIQYMISGEELITVAPVSELEVCDPYNTEKDITFYKNCLLGNEYLLSTGTFLILMPGEGHMPCISLNGKQTIRKAVIKVPLYGRTCSK